MDPMFAGHSSVAHAIGVMARFQEGAGVLSEGSVLVVIGKSRFPTPYSNVAFPLDEQADPRTFLDVAAARFPDRRYFVWARGDFARALEPVATERGFMSFGTIPSMVMDGPLDGRPADGLDVSRATTSEAFQDFVHVSALAYAEAGLPVDVAKSQLARAEEATALADIFVVRDDSGPLSAALSITNAETHIGGVHWVGTVPGARRRGAATAVTRAATNAAFERGATIVALEASPLGEPVYRRLGYREICRYVRMLSPSR